MSVASVIGEGVGGLLAAPGAVLSLIGAVGMLRFPDFYTRLHATSLGDGAAAALMLFGLAVSSGDVGLALRLVLLGALLAALQPVATHLMASSAHAGGLAPIAGRYAAPRPGAPKLGGDTL